MNSSKKIKSLAQFLNCKKSEITQSTYDANIFEYSDQEYMVCTEDEAQEAVKLNIMDSLWAFNSDFIFNFLDIDYNEREIKAFQEMQQEMCESANPIIELMIRGKEDDFVNEATKTDGRGHFLSYYDGEEKEQDDFFIYRTN